MARVVICLLEPELHALNQLALQEYRPSKSQAALIIQNELKRHGSIEEQPAGGETLPATSPESDGRGSAW